MNHFLKRLRHFNRSSLVGSVAIAAAGSVFLCSDNNSDFRASVPLQDSLPSTIANAAAKVAPAVVNISVPRVFLVIPIGKSHGSGTIIDDDGTILTSAHVVLSSRWKRRSPKGKVEVTLHDGRTFEGKVVNANRLSDIAIVKINSETPLPEAKLGSSSRLRPGDWVIAMGSPLSLKNTVTAGIGDWVIAVGCRLSLKNTVTAGIISSVDRKNSGFRLRGMPGKYLEIDCVTNKLYGNSGGPLVNIDGEVVGVNLYKGDEGLSFSVPIDLVCKVIEHFKKTGRVIWAFHGLKMLDLNEMIIAEFKKRHTSFPNVNKGILVQRVIPGSLGDRVGLLPGDVVIEFDGKPVERIEEVIEIMWDKVEAKVEGPLKVLVKRANDELVTLIMFLEEPRDLILYRE